MFSLRRCASRLLASRSTFISSTSRTYTSITSPALRLAQRGPSFQIQKRWATNEAVVESEPPVEKVEATPAEEAENEAELEAASTGFDPVVAETANAFEATDSAPAIAETANATEATEETVPAAETGETFAADAPYQPISREPGQNDAGASFGQKRTLYIGNLFFDVTETDIVKEFSRFGTVARCRIIRDSRGLSKGFGYIEFSTQDAADQALQRLNLTLFEGRRITVQYASRDSTPIDTENIERKPQNPPSKTLFIGNMSFEMTDRDLTNLFRGIRNVIDVRVAIDRRTGQPRGFAHADFIDVKSAMEAMKTLTEKEIYGRRLRVDFSWNSASKAPRNDRKGDDSPAGTN